MPASKQASSYSVRRTPTRKCGNKSGNGDSQTQPRAEFRGPKHSPYYVSYHGTYDPVNLPPKGYSAGSKPSTRNQPYAKREEPPYIPSPSSGPVGPDLDWSVRARNVPIIFVKQLRDKGGLLTTKDGSRPYMIAFNTLFSDFNNFYVEAKYRPKIGCVPTRSWTDAQVRTWTKLAHHIGVQYSGKREYSFPKGTLGETVAGSYYSRNVPWPTPGSEGSKIFPFFERPRSGRRSESSRILRSFKKIKKMEVTPFDFQANLIVRREKTCREIRNSYWKTDRSIPFREYRNSVPLVLCLNTRRPAKVPDIVLGALRRIAVRTQKMLPSSPWVVPKADPIQPKYTVSVHNPPNKQVVHRLRAVMCSDGNIYSQRSSVDGRVNLMVRRPDLTSEQLMHAIRKTAAFQSKFDSYYPQDPPDDEAPSILGGWDDDW
jgi:hypothetical protein